MSGQLAAGSVHSVTLIEMRTCLDLLQARRVPLRNFTWNYFHRIVWAVRTEVKNENQLQLGTRVYEEEVERRVWIHFLDPTGAYANVHDDFKTLFMSFPMPLVTTTMSERKMPTGTYWTVTYRTTRYFTNVAYVPPLPGSAAYTYPLGIPRAPPAANASMAVPSPAPPPNLSGSRNSVRCSSTGNIPNGGINGGSRA